MSRSPSHLTGGIVWKNLKEHQRIAIISEDNAGRDWKLPVVEQDPYALSKTDPFQEIAKMVGQNLKIPFPQIRCSTPILIRPNTPSSGTSG